MKSKKTEQIEQESRFINKEDLNKRFNCHKKQVIEDLRKRRIAYEHKFRVKEEILEETM